MCERLADATEKRIVGVMTFNLCARGATEGVAAARVAQKGGNRGRKRLRVVGKEDVLTMNEEEALGTDNHDSS